MHEKMAGPLQRIDDGGQQCNANHSFSLMYSCQLLATATNIVCDSVSGNNMRGFHKLGPELSQPTTREFLDCTPLLCCVTSMRFIGPCMAMRTDRRVPMSRARAFWNNATVIINPLRAKRCIQAVSCLLLNSTDSNIFALTK